MSGKSDEDETLREPLTSQEHLAYKEEGEDDDDDDLSDGLVDLELQAESGLDLSHRKRSRIGKYKPALKSLIPVRVNNRPKDELPESSAGLFSLLTYAWLTPIMWKVYKKGTGFLQHMRCADVNRAQVNAERLERLWQEELKKKGPKKASFRRVMWQAVRTRVLIAGLTFIISVTFSFTGPAFLLNRLLRNLSSGTLELSNGIVLVLGLSCLEFGKTMTFAIGWVMNYTTGVRMRGAALSLLYSKILKLRGLKDKTVGELVNVCTNDGQRLFEACAIGPLLIGGPFILLYGTIYTVFLIGPWALVGSATYISFYPFMALVSRMTAYFRREGIVITDKRVRMMSELLNCIKLIKMYAWEKSFAKTIAGIRSEERSILEKAAYVNSISTSAAPMVPVMASVFVIVAHVLTGNDLSAAQAFTLLAVFNAMRFSLGVIPYAVKALADSNVSFKRYKAFVLVSVNNKIKPAMNHMAKFVKTFGEMKVVGERIKAFTLISINNKIKPAMNHIGQFVKVLGEMTVVGERIQSVLLMEEIKPHQGQIHNPNIAIVMKKATLAWDSVQGDAGNTKKVGLSDIEIKVPNGNSKEVSNDAKDEEKQKLHEANNDIETESDVVPALLDIDFTMEKGKLIGVCGSVGSGKSSLISGILGRMILVSGKVAIRGSIAYVSQQAWIMNATARDNILFGQMYNEEKYNKVVEACCLKEDFESLDNGDGTEIGERGINLSGGQKQRLSLARAMYADKDIYLLDDPLSAVDIHVGRHIFTECLAKGLKGKSVVFVTHQLQYLNQCDGIIVIKDGMIAERGRHKDLMKDNGEYATLISKYYSQDDSGETDEAAAEPGSPVPDNPKERANSVGSPRDKSLLAERQTSVVSRKRLDSRTSQLSGGKANGVERQFSAMSAKSSIPEDQPKKGRLMVAEETARGKVTARTYFSYIQAAGGIFVTLIVLLVYISSVAVSTGTSWWLSYWLNQGSGNTSIEIGDNMTVISRSIRDNPDMNFYAMIYGLGVIVIVTTTALRAFLFMKVTLHASSKIHDKNFKKILQCPMKFFDTTPVGRIINRFANDMDEIDVRLPGSAEVFIMNILLILFALISISYVSPWFLIALVPLVAFFVVLNVLFTSGVRELKRMDARTRSPLISHIQASVQGISTIHAFGKTSEFQDKFHNLLDTNAVPFFLFYSSNRWLAVRLDLISVIVIGITGLLVTLTYRSMTPALAGMALSFAIQMTGLFQFTIRMAIETEARFTSVERLIHYEKEAESEAPAVIKNNRPPNDWPTDGTVVFKKVKLRYRENLPFALKGISFDVLPREKIGIVGRSGSGKSSLGVALFRLVELESGSINIDRIDISTIGLNDLRSKLSIIPQDPVLFIGTVRYNLDPFQQHTDEEMWSALEKCHIKDTIKSLEHQLETKVVENGENFSVGERQLLCLARALLRHSKIIMLDEATAAIDTETDALVQTTIKEAFADCTMLIIAHRLNTVLTCNRILVVEDGKIVEYDTPSKLTSDPKSKFKIMLEATENQ